jgi:hypothetical protein
MENPAATVPGGTAFQDPDEQLLTAPPKDDSLQLKTDNSDPQAASELLFNSRQEQLCRLRMDLHRL